LKKLVAAASAVLLILLTACSQVNSAATIGKTEIPVSTIEKTVNGILAERSKVDTTGMQLQTGATLNVSAVRFHVLSVLFDDIAAKMKMPIPDADLAKRRASIISQINGEAQLPKALVNAGIASFDFPRYVRTVLIAENLTQALKAAGDTSTDGSSIQKLIISMANEKKVVINPKYGSWDYTTGNIVDSAANSAVKTK
jgi:hypothetical protein